MWPMRSKFGDGELYQRPAELMVQLKLNDGKLNF